MAKHRRADEQSDPPTPPVVCLYPRETPEGAAQTETAARLMWATELGYSRMPLPEGGWDSLGETEKNQYRRIARAALDSLIEKG